MIKIDDSDPELYSPPSDWPEHIPVSRLYRVTFSDGRNTTTASQKGPMDAARLCAKAELAPMSAVVSIQHDPIKVCPECGRAFWLRDKTDATEWQYGHDCEA